MILTNSNRFRCLKIRHLIYLCMVGIYIWFWQTQTVFGVWKSDTQFISAWLVFIYDFDKLKPFSVSEIQTPNVSLHGWYLYMILTNSNRFRCLKIRHPIYICMVGIYIWFWQNYLNANRFRCLKFRHLIYLSLHAWLVFIYDFDKLKPFLVSEIQTPNLSLFGIYVWFWQTQTDFGAWNSATLFIFISDNGWYIYI
jgi:hypothetical protein